MATGDKKRAVMTTDIDNGSSTYPVLSPSGDGSDVTAAFTAASTRTNISTGEKLTVIFGKVAKWFSDLGAAAFRGVDAAPTAGSTNLVESGGVKSAIDDAENITVTPESNVSLNAVVYARRIGHTLYFAIDATTSAQQDSFVKIGNGDAKITLPSNISYWYFNVTPNNGNAGQVFGRMYNIAGGGLYLQILRAADFGNPIAGRYMTNGAIPLK